jgi:hypothetical protein
MMPLGTEGADSTASSSAPSRYRTWTHAPHPTAPSRRDTFPGPFPVILTLPNRKNSSLVERRGRSISGTARRVAEASRDKGGSRRGRDGSQPTLYPPTLPVHVSITTALSAGLRTCDRSASICLTHPFPPPEAHSGGASMKAAAFCKAASYLTRNNKGRSRWRGVRTIPRRLLILASPLRLIWPALLVNIQ